VTYEILSAVQRTPEWIEARQEGIGASEAAAALGLSRWESPYSLWCRKLGLVPPPEVSLAMEIGSATEALNAARYEAATGFRVRRANRLLRSREHPFLLASLDRWIVGEDAVLEMKWTEHGTGYGEPGTDQVPDEVAAQVVHQMAVTGRSRADVSVLFGSRRHAVYTVWRDTAAEAAVVARLARFWRHVEDRTQPELDGSDATLDALAGRYPQDDGAELEADDRSAAALAAYLDAADREADAKAAMAEARAVLEAFTGDAALLRAPGVGSLSWKTSKAAAQVAWRAVAEGMADLDRARFGGLVASATSLKKAGRPFLASREEESHGNR
jgi:putative phage-type endonuclease